MIRRPRNLSGLMTSSSVAMASSLLGVGQAGGGGAPAYSLQSAFSADSVPAGFYLARNSCRPIYSVEDSADTNPISNAQGVIQQAGATHQIIFLGDSITFGSGINTATFPYYVIKKLREDRGVICNYKSAAIGGQGLNSQFGGNDVPTLNNHATAQVDPAISGTLANIYVIWAGTNDIELNGTTGAATYTLLTTNINARITAGYAANRIFVMPMMPRGIGTEETDRGTFNSAIAGDAGAIGYKPVTLPSDLINAGAQNNSTYFQTDAIHPKNAGAALAADTLIAKMVAEGAVP